MKSRLYPAETVTIPIDAIQEAAIKLAQLYRDSKIDREWFTELASEIETELAKSDDELGKQLSEMRRRFGYED